MSEYHELAGIAWDQCHPPRLVLDGEPHGSDFATRLFASAQAVEQASSGAISVGRDAVECPPARPAMTVVATDHAPIHYLAVPEGPEAGPFVEALVALATSPERDSTMCLTSPAHLLVYVAPDCSNCPHAVRAALRLAVNDTDVTVTVVDAMHFHALAETHRVSSVPTTIIDGELTIVGSTSSELLFDRLRSRGTGPYRREVLASLLDSGRLDAAAHRLLQRDAVDHLTTLWQDSTMSRRISLLLVAQAALERDPAVLDSAVARLVPLLASEDVAERGDTADLLGQIAHHDATQALEGLSVDDDPDVAEAALEALDRIHRRQRACEGGHP